MMLLSILSQKKTVLLLGDESLYVYCAASGATSLAYTSSWDSETLISDVIDVIKKTCGGSPIVILNDMVEQHYRKEKVLKAGVNALDKASMLKRKLAVAFPDYRIRAAHPLKEKVKASHNKVAADVYIFAAIPYMRQMETAVSIVKNSFSSFKGVGLLPVESASLVKKLSEQLTEKKQKPSKWCILIGQHKSGSLRQIVTKDGDLALTRMTPVIDTDSDMHRWVTEVDQELKATISYLSRFGYAPEDGLDVVVISNADAGGLLAEAVNDDINFHALTVSEAARLLGISIGRQESQKYADPLHVTWAAKKNSLTLPMRDDRVDEVARPRQMAFAASALLACSALFFMYQFFTDASKLSQINKDIKIEVEKRDKLQIEYDEEVALKESMGFDVRLVQNSMIIHAKLMEKSINFTEVFDAVGAALGRDLRLDQLNVAPYEEDMIEKFASRSNVPLPFGANASEYLFQTSLQMTYPSTTNIEKGNLEVKALRDRMEKLLPGYDVKISKLLKDYEYTEDIVVEAGDVGNKNIAQDFVAQLDILGPMKKDDLK